MSWCSMHNKRLCDECGICPADAAQHAKGCSRYREPNVEAVKAAEELTSDAEERIRYAHRIQRAIDAVISQVKDADPSGASDWSHE